MIKKADIKIDNTYVLFLDRVDRNGKVGSPALNILRDAVHVKSGVDVSCLSVWHKCFELRHNNSIFLAQEVRNVPQWPKRESTHPRGLTTRFEDRESYLAACVVRDKEKQKEQAAASASTAMQMAKESVQTRKKQEATMPAGRTTRLPVLRLTALEHEAAKAFFAQDEYLDKPDLRSPTPPLSPQQAPPPTSARAGGSYDDIRPSLPQKRLWVPSPPTSPSSQNVAPPPLLTYAAAILNRSLDDLPLPPLPPLPSSQKRSAEASAKDNSGLSQYEKDRLARIESNKELMRALGIFDPTTATESAANSAVKPRRPHTKIPKGRPAERQKSERTEGKVVNYKELDRSRSPSPGPAETEHVGSSLPETHGKEQRCSSPELPSWICDRLRDKSSK